MNAGDVTFLLAEASGRAYGPYHAKCAMLTVLAFQCQADAEHPHPRELQRPLPTPPSESGMDTRSTE